jgi:hypothetical protein
LNVVEFPCTAGAEDSADACAHLHTVDSNREPSKLADEEKCRNKCERSQQARPKRRKVEDLQDKYRTRPQTR